MLVFFDSSAFAKRYVQELGSETVGEWCDRATEIGLAAIALPEIVSAFCRLQREGKITLEQYQQLKGELFADIDDFFAGFFRRLILGHCHGRSTSKTEHHGHHQHHT